MSRAFDYDPFPDDPLLSERSPMNRRLPGPRRRRKLLRANHDRLDQALASLAAVVATEGTPAVCTATTMVLRAFETALTLPADEVVHDERGEAGVETHDFQDLNALLAQALAEGSVPVSGRFETSPSPARTRALGRPQNPLNPESSAWRPGEGPKAGHLSPGECVALSVPLSGV